MGWDINRSTSFSGFDGEKVDPDQRTSSYGFPNVSSVRQKTSSTDSESKISIWDKDFPLLGIMKAGAVYLGSCIFRSLSDSLGALCKVFCKTQAAADQNRREKQEAKEEIKEKCEDDFSKYKKGELLFSAVIRSADSNKLEED